MLCFVSSVQHQQLTEEAPGPTIMLNWSCIPNSQKVRGRSPYFKWVRVSCRRRNRTFLSRGIHHRGMHSVGGCCHVAMSTPSHLPLFGSCSSNVGSIHDYHYSAGNVVMHIPSTLCIHRRDRQRTANMGAWLRQHAHRIPQPHIAVTCRGTWPRCCFRCPFRCWNITCGAHAEDGWALIPASMPPQHPPTTVRNAHFLLCMIVDCRLLSLQLFSITNQTVVNSMHRFYRQQRRLGRCRLAVQHPLQAVHRLWQGLGRHPGKAEAEEARLRRVAVLAGGENDPGLIADTLPECQLSLPSRVGQPLPAGPRAAASNSHWRQPRQVDKGPWLLVTRVRRAGCRLSKDVRHVELAAQAGLRQRRPPQPATAQHPPEVNPHKHAAHGRQERDTLLLQRSCRHRRGQRRQLVRSRWDAVREAPSLAPWPLHASPPGRLCSWHRRGLRRPAPSHPALCTHQ